MNWTGGRLSRHSNAKRSLKDRQKQHFAKVQASIRTGPKKPSPLKFSFLGDVTENTDIIRYPSTACGTSCSREIAKSVIAEQDSSIAPLRLPHDNTCHTYPLQVSHIKDEANRGFILGCVQEEDLYSATPLPSLRKRRRDLSTDRAVGNNGQDEENDSGSRRRKRILQQGDWVGVRVQRPLQLAFASPNHAELVGRRRKLTDGHRARYNSTMQPSIKNPFATPDQIDEETAPLGNSEVRVSIGSRVAPPGRNSNSVTSARRGTSARSGPFNRSQESSSDVMLLDNEDCAGMNRQGRTGRYLSERSRPTDTHRSDRSNRNHNPHHSDSVSNRGLDRYDWQSVVLSSSQDDVQIQEDPNIEGQPIIASSTTSLQHPRPQSSKTSLILRSDSTDVAASVVGEVGSSSVQSAISNSQVAENEIWAPWLRKYFVDRDPQPIPRGIFDTVDPAERDARVRQPPVSHHRGRRVEPNDKHFSPRPGYRRPSANADPSGPSNKSRSIRNKVARGAALFRPGAKAKGIPSPVEPPVDNGPGEHGPKEIRRIDKHAKAHGGPDLERLWRSFVFGHGRPDFEAPDA